MQMVGRFGFHIEIRRPLPCCRCIIRYFIKIIYRIIAFKPCAPTSHSYIYKEIQSRDCSWTVLVMTGMQGLDVVTEGPALGMGAKQGLEEGNGEPVRGKAWRQGLEARSGGKEWRRGVEAWRMGRLTGRLCALPNLRPRTPGFQGTQRHICVA